MKNRNKDLPFTTEEIIAIKAELYLVNSTNQCINPAHPSWYSAFEDLRKIKARKDTTSYKAWLESELARL